jgi:hypothetical protein
MTERRPAMSRLLNRGTGTPIARGASLAHDSS